VTVGGSHSNHIAAVAEAGNVFGFKTIGLIRGYESYRENETLKKAAQKGMEIRFFDKKQFSNIEPEVLPQLKQEIGSFEFVPMGGGNLLGMKGCVEINEDIPNNTTHILSACGTGSTLAGIIAGANQNQTILGFPAMKNGDFMKDDVAEFLSNYSAKSHPSFEIITDYHFSGFAKLKPELVGFINKFNRNQGFA
jgi:1-aminocyclopropane-1-carboxylate deaminase/D-cysteine desulfhydrase-like pyridoxal-dependent ACC family enzyme